MSLEDEDIDEYATSNTRCLMEKTRNCQGRTIIPEYATCNAKGEEAWTHNNEPLSPDQRDMWDVYICNECGHHKYVDPGVVNPLHILAQEVLDAS